MNDTDPRIFFPGEAVPRQQSSLYVVREGESGPFYPQGYTSVAQAQIAQNRIRQGHDPQPGVPIDPATGVPTQTPDPRGYLDPAEPGLLRDGRRIELTPTTSGTTADTRVYNATLFNPDGSVSDRTTLTASRVYHDRTTFLVELLGGHRIDSEQLTVNAMAETYLWLRDLLRRLGIDPDAQAYEFESEHHWNDCRSVAVNRAWREQQAAHAEDAPA